MFDVAEIGSTLAKEEYKARMPDIRAQLLEAQFHLKRLGVPVLIAVAGDDRIGSEQVIDLLNEWLDARYVDTWSPALDLKILVRTVGTVVRGDGAY